MCIGVALRCSEPKEPHRLGNVSLPALAVHEQPGAEITLRAGVALRCSEPEEPPRLSNVLPPAVASPPYLSHLHLEA